MVENLCQVSSATYTYFADCEASFDQLRRACTEAPPQPAQGIFPGPVTATAL